MSNKAWIYAGLGIAAGMSAVGLVRVLRQPRVRSGKSRVFLFGDSLAVGLEPHLKALSQEANIAFDSVTKSGTRIDQWAKSQVLLDRLGKFQPTLVLISLGTNDEYLGSGAATKQAPYLSELLKNVKKFAPEVVWIGPPTLPRPSSGIVKLIRGNISSDHYFPSDTLEIPRGPDGLHPTARGYAAWAGALWRWLS